MKRLIVYVLLMLMSSVTVHAQSGSEGDGDRQDPSQNQSQSQNRGQSQKGGGDRIAQMQKNLHLSDEQVKQMHKIREDGGDRKQIRAVLTDEQRALMRERRKSQGNKGKGDPSRYYTQPQDNPPADPDGG
jgi:TolA-binding protein